MKKSVVLADTEAIPGGKLEVKPNSKPQVATTTQKARMAPLISETKKWLNSAGA